MMNLVRLPGLDTHRFWDLIEEGLRNSLPPTAIVLNGRLDGLKQAFAQERYQCWVISDERRPIACAVTTISEDIGTGCRSLLIYALFTIGTSEIPEPFYQEGLEVLKAFARRANCVSVQAYTTHPGIVKLAEELGADTSWRLIRFPINPKEGDDNG